MWSFTSSDDPFFLTGSDEITIVQLTGLRLFEPNLFLLPLLHSFLATYTEIIKEICSLMWVEKRGKVKIWLLKWICLVETCKYDTSTFFTGLTLEGILLKRSYILFYLRGIVILEQNRLLHWSSLGLIMLGKEPGLPLDSKKQQPGRGNKDQPLTGLH